MKIELMSKDVPNVIIEFVTYINKSDNMTALIQPNLTKEGYRIIKVESFK